MGFNSAFKGLISKQRNVPNRLTQLFVFRKRLEAFSMRSRVPVITLEYYCCCLFHNEPVLGLCSIFYILTFVWLLTLQITAVKSSG